MGRRRAAVNSYQVVPIGWVESPLTDRAQAPRQGDEGAPDAWLVFEPGVAEGIRDLDAGTEILVLTWLDRAARDHAGQVENQECQLDRARPAGGVIRIIPGGMDGEVHVAQLAPPMRLGITVPLFLQRDSKHVSVETHQPHGLVGDEDDSGDVPHIFRSFWRAAGHQITFSRSFL
jgi:hypothetical protein